MTPRRIKHDHFLNTLLIVRAKKKHKYKLLNFLKIKL